MGWVSPIKNEETLKKFEKSLMDIDVKYYIMFRIGLGTGLLLQDVLKLKNKDVINKTEMRVLIGARKIERVFNIPEDLQNTIKEYIGDKDPESYLITGHIGSSTPLSREQAYRVFKMAGKLIGLNTIGAQTMRKTFAWQYFQETNDIAYLQQLFNHASPSITYRYIGEKPNVQIVLKKLTPEENERSRYLLYLDNSGKKRIDAAISQLNEIKDKFDSPFNNDSFYGCVDCFLDELDELIESYKSSNTSPYQID